MNSNEVAALSAGLMISDGSVGINQNTHSGKTYHRQYIALRMSDEETVKRFAEWWELDVRSYRGKNGLVMWSAETRRADKVLEIVAALLPYMSGPKKTSMEFAEQMARSITARSGMTRNNEGLPENVVAYRKRLHDAYKRHVDSYLYRAGATTE